MPKLLIADDDDKLVQNIADWLRSEKFTVETTNDGDAAAILLSSITYDVVILDWEMPGKSGPTVCKDFRDSGGDTPILMLTGKGAIEEKEKGFLSGADDYLTKPFHPKELLLRIRSLLNRRVEPNRGTYKYGALVLDSAKTTISSDGEKLKLTGKEYALLDFLIRHPEQCFTTDALINRVWNSDKAVTDQAVRVCVARLRDKLEASSCPNTVIAEPGFGYKLATKEG